MAFIPFHGGGASGNGCDSGSEDDDDAIVLRDECRNWLWDRWVLYRAGYIHSSWGSLRTLLTVAACAGAACCRSGGVHYISMLVLLSLHSSSSCGDVS